MCKANAWLSEVRVRIVILLVAGLVFTACPVAEAQTPGAPYKFQVTPYVWFAGLDGSIGARGRTADVEASAGDVLDHLHLAGMGTFEVRGEKWRFLADTLYVNLRGQKGIPDPGATSVEVSPRTFFFDPEFGYAVFRHETVDIDVMAGIRTWHLKNELQFTQGGGQLTFEHSKGWTDPIVGLRFNSDFAKHWFATGKADIGGFSAAARLDWQAFGGLGYKLNDTIVVTGGYRYLSVDYSNEGFTFDTAMKGVIVGIGFRF
jgi:hypothetical protein